LQKGRGFGNSLPKINIQQYYLLNEVAVTSVTQARWQDQSEFLQDFDTAAGAALLMCTLDGGFAYRCFLAYNETAVEASQLRNPPRIMS